MTQAQVNLHQVGRDVTSSAINLVMNIFHEHGLDVVQGAINTTIVGAHDALFAALQEAYQQVSEQSAVVMSVLLCNSCSEPTYEEGNKIYSAIGYVENAFDEPAAPDVIRSVESQIVLHPTLTEGLRGLEVRQRVLVIFSFHRSHGYDLLQHPRGDINRPKRGVFALCSPRRPVPIGVSEVELVAIEGNILRVRGLDAINGTPVLDLKPA